MAKVRDFPVSQQKEAQALEKAKKVRQANATKPVLQKTVNQTVSVEKKESKT